MGRPERDDEVRSIVECAKGGDVEAFGRLYDRYVDGIYRFVLFRIGNSHDAEDITEQTFVRAFEAIGRYKWQDVPFSAWLYRIARNLVTDQFRKRGRVSEVDLEDVSHMLTVDRGTAEEVVARLDAVEVHEAIGKLTEAQRNVVLMKFFGGLTNAEVGAAIGKNEGSVKSLQHRALQTLGRILTKEES